MKLVGDDLHCVLAADVDNLGPDDWGRALAYLARVVAERSRGPDPGGVAAAIAAIRVAFIQELAAPDGQEE
jgi:hypothetical protein